MKLTQVNTTVLYLSSTNDSHYYVYPVAAILHIGDIEFTSQEAEDNTDSCVIKNIHKVNTGNTRNTVGPKSRDVNISWIIYEYLVIPYLSA